jgi:hypothetical protein
VRAARAFHFRCIFTLGRQAETLGYETAGYFNSRVVAIPYTDVRRSASL